jgi:3-methyladenine DNA glycosylase/8-oxoguanine DNA glycosylase
VTRLCFDPDEAIEQLARADRKLARVIERAGPFSHRPQRLQDPFQALLRSIVYQQLSGKAAETIFGRVSALHVKLTPEALLGTPDDLLRAAGLSRGKVLAVKDLSAKVLDGTVPTLKALRKMEDADIVSRLTEVRGIGPWTVEMLLIFRLGRPDVLPVSDFGVRKGFMLTYGKQQMPSPKELFEHGERWRPFRSVASWYMWRALDLSRKTDLPAEKKPSKKPVKARKPKATAR